MKILRTWTVVVALMISLATPWTLLQSAAWFGMLIRYSKEGSFTRAVEMTFDGEHPCQLCKIVRQGQSEEREQKRPLANYRDLKLQLALPPLSGIVLCPPPPGSVFQGPRFPGLRPIRPPIPPPRSA